MFKVARDVLGFTFFTFIITRGSVGWACVAHLSFCFDEILYIIFYRCFLPNFNSFDQMVLEEILLIGQSQTRTSHGGHVNFSTGKAFSEEKIFINWQTRNKNSVHLTKRFRGEEFLEIDHPETRIVYGGHICYQIGTQWTIFIENLPEMLPTKFRFIWLSAFKGEDFF